jgi:hypothetical protein
MKLLSFDIGIRHLSYCLLQFEENTMSINDWNVIDLVHYETNNIQIDSCHLLHNIKVYSKEQLIEFIEKHNFEYTIDKKVKKDALKKDFQQFLLQFLKKKYNVTKDTFSPLDIVSLKLYSFLRNTEMIQSIDALAIENQPALKNPLMKSLQMIIYTYFFGIFANKNLYLHVKKEMKTKTKEYTIFPIQLVSASNKTNIKLKNKNLLKDTTYKERKTKSIEICKDVLEKGFVSQHLEFFNNHSKKDDLADSFLQGIYVLQEHYQVCEI